MVSLKIVNKNQFYDSLNRYKRILIYLYIMSDSSDFDSNLVDSIVDSVINDSDVRSSAINVCKNAYDDVDDVENIDIEEDEPEEIVVPDEFKNTVRKFLTVDDEIKAKQAEIKELKDKKKPCEEYILLYLDKLNRKELEAGTNKLRKNQSETKKKIDSKIIKDSIGDKLKNPALVKKVSDKLRQPILAKIKNNQVTQEILNLVENSVRDLLEDPLLVTDILEEMENKRDKVVRVNLKRTGARAKRKKQ